MRQTTIKTSYIWLLLLLSLSLAILASLSVGYANTSLIDVWELLQGNASSTTQFIMMTIRLPRIIACLLGGGSLALAGLLLQNLTKNPLADSGILGVNAGAGLFISLLIGFVNLSDIQAIIAMPFAAMIGGTVTIFVVYWISRKKNHSISPTRLVITGVGMSSMISGMMITILSSLSELKINLIIEWLSGKITTPSWNMLTLFGVILICLWGLTYSQSQSLNIMSLNEQSALALGLNLQQQRLIIMMLATALASLSVVIVGNMTFIGLISGHITKKVLGNDYHLSIPASLLVGMLLLLISDTIGRVLLVGTGIPTGIVVTLIGAPYFLYLMLKTDR